METLNDCLMKECLDVCVCVCAGNTEKEDDLQCDCVSDIDLDRSVHIRSQSCSN